MKSIWLAALLFSFGTALAQQEVILIDGFMPDSAAEKAGLRAGDRIVALDGTKVAVLQDLRVVLAAHQVGDQVPIRIQREGETLKLTIRLGERPGGIVSLGVMLRTVQQSGVAVNKPMDARQRAAALRAAAKAVREGYVFEAKGNKMAQQLEAAAEKDRFSASTTLVSFVSSLNALLAEMGNDKHLRAGIGRPRFGGDESHGPEPEEDPEAQAGHDESRGHNRRGHAPMDPNLGVREAKMLEGNIGYLDLSMFAGEAAAKVKLNEAMLALAGSDVLIIDLRQNGGGEGQMVSYLSGFLFPERTHLTNRMSRNMETPQEHWTQGGQPTRAFNEKPVLLLISGQTFSAAEAFAFGLKIAGRATLLGQRTGGGGHFGDDVALSEDLRLFLPMGRTYNPATGEGWEAEGIAPDIVVPEGEVLGRAVTEARRMIAARARG